MTELFVNVGTMVIALDIGEFVVFVPCTEGITTEPEDPKPVFVLLLFHV